MGPELLVRRSRMMKGKHLQNERHDNAQGGSVDQNLVGGKPKHVGNLQDLHDVERQGCGERGYTAPEPHNANVPDQWLSHPEVHTSGLTQSMGTLHTEATTLKLDLSRSNQATLRVLWATAVAAALLPIDCSRPAVR